MKRKAVLLWCVYFLNLMVVPRFFVVQLADGRLQVNRQIYIFLQLVTAAIAVWLYRREIEAGIKRLKGRHLGRDVAIGYGIRIVLTILLSLVVPLQQTDNQAAVESLMQSTSLVSMIALTCIFAPIVEELVFREGIIGAFKDRVNPWVLAVVSAVLFIALHSLSNSGGIDGRAALMYLPLTIPLVGIYRYYDDNIVASMAMHFVSNAIAMVALLIQMHGF